MEKGWEKDNLQPSIYRIGEFVMIIITTNPVKACDDPFRRLGVNINTQANPAEYMKVQRPFGHPNALQHKRLR
jgi:hypothetical protein